MPFVKGNKLYQLAKSDRKYYKDVVTTKYWKYVYESWTRPNLSSDGTLGGSSFAVSRTGGSGTTLTGSTYASMDGNASTSCKFTYSSNGSSYTFYNPNPLLLTSIQFSYYDGNSAYGVKKGNLQASDDNSAWTTLATFNSNLSTWTINATKHYKYFKINITEGYDVMLTEIKVNAKQYTKTVESNSSDYSYTTQETVTTETGVDGDWNRFEVVNMKAYTPVIQDDFTYRITHKQTATGTYTITLDRDCEGNLLFVGNGGGGGSAETYGAWFQSCGGSGACFQGRVRLPKGTYTLTIGTLGYGYNINNSQDYTGGVDSTDSFLKDSNGNELIRVGCGVRGKTAKTGAAGGTLTLGNLDIVETIIAKNGNQGQFDDPNNWSSTNAYALSAYDNTRNGYGAGTGSWYGGGNVYGIAGIFKLDVEYLEKGIRSY